MVKNKNTGLVLLALGLAGCASTQPSVGPWGYDFAITRIEDVRPDDDTKVMASDLFTAEKFTRAWQAAVARPTWGVMQGELAVRITKYEATSFNGTYALSMEADLVGRAGDPVPSYRADAKPIVAQVAGQCSAYGTGIRGQSGAAMVRGVLGQANVPQAGGKAAPSGYEALTPSGRDATLWQEMWNQCVAQLATQFSDRLLAGAPALPADTRGR